jgi:AraC-like DNA-binding protein
MDALSEALGSVHITGAVFYDAVCTKPWAFAVPPLSTYAQLLAPATERLVSYHLITEGGGIARFGDDVELSIEEGDVVVVPHGDAHVMSDGPVVRVLDKGVSLDRFLAGGVSVFEMGGGGAMTRFVCGYFGCERDADRLFLSGLPRVFKINLRSDDTGRWLEHSIRHLVSESESSRPGRSLMLAKMAETLFIEAMRRYMAQLPPEQTGWLAGARDPIVGAAIAAMHRQPGACWSLDSLATTTGASRSVLIERFARFLGQPPLAYLAMWRLQLASRRLLASRDTVMQIALDVGYQSEAAFIRAFKREFGSSPGVYRRSKTPVR